MHRAVLALPFLVVLAPIVHLWAQNSGIVRPASVAPPLLVTMLLTAVALSVLRALTRDALRSAISVAVAWIPILTFGYQVDAATAAFPEASDASVGWLLFALNAAATAGLVTITWRASSGVRQSAEYMAGATLIFTLLSAPPILGGVRLNDSVPALEPTDDVEGVAVPSEQPDIYFIVLDGYGRGDVLSELYAHENSPFLDALREQGFFVADESFSNYAITPLSLAATLNMRYIDELHDVMGHGDTRPALKDLIQQPEIVHRLHALGYRYVHFDTMYWGTEDAPLADVSFSREAFLQSEFAAVLLKTTALRYVWDMAPAWHQVHLDTLEHLREVPQLDGPTFAFAHLLLPHPPYVFDSAGRVLRHEAELIGGWDEPAAYIEQLKFLNTQLQELVRVLITESEHPPVIILQGDHGPARTLFERGSETVTIYRERMGILNAQLVPPQIRSALYPSISPVNTFRVLMNGLFGDDMALLPDESFYSWSYPVDSPALAANPQELRDVTDLVRSRP
jgi:hypothetical protein